MTRWLWWIVATLRSVMLVCDIMTGAPAFEDGALMMLALILAKLDATNEEW